MKLLYLTNIPAPYRQKRFNVMAEVFPKYGIDFEVLYMAKIEPDRNWIVPENSYHYRYKIFNGFHPTIGKFYAHFNPSLLYRLMKRDYDIIVIGGMANPTLWLAPYFVPSFVKKIMSIETNLKGNTKKHGLVKAIKGVLLGKADAYQITGKPQKEYISYFSNSSVSKKFITLPNLIDGNFFIEEVDRYRKGGHATKMKMKLGVRDDMQIWIVPSRLVANKISDTFVEATKILKDVRVIIIGTGPLRESLQKRIKLNNLPIILIPFVQQDELVKYLSIADVFCLASFEDPSPLSVIEACASALPILVSNTIGNLDDVLNENEHGYSFNPRDLASIETAFKKMYYNQKDKLIEMGKISRVIYHENFDPHVCLNHYGKGLIEVINKKQ